MSKQPTGNKDAVEHHEKALALSRKIGEKVDDLFSPLEMEMKTMKWPSQYRSIMWEAVMLGAKKRWEECE